MSTIIYILFFLGFLPILVLILYPAWVALLANLQPNPVQKSSIFEAPVSIILNCYNEEKYIDSKIQSIIDEFEWISGSELIIVSAGSTDQTNQLLKQYDEEPKVRCFPLLNRVSKIEAVNFGVEQSQHKLLIFTDCRQDMKPGSIRQIMQNFNDPEVGTVAAKLEDTKKSKTPSMWRSLLGSIATSESKYSSCLNVYGALYGQRKSVYRTISKEILFDDLFVVVSTLSQGKRLIQDSEAIIYDIRFEDYYQKGRIKRLVRGLLLFITQQFGLIKSIPTNLFIRFLIFKYLKLLLPIFTFLIVVSSTLHLLLTDRYITLASIIFGLILLLLFPKTRSVLNTFGKINFFFLIGVMQFLTGKERSVHWKKLNEKQ